MKRSVAPWLVVSGLCTAVGCLDRPPSHSGMGTAPAPSAAADKAAAEEEAENNKPVPTVADNTPQPKRTTAPGQSIVEKGIGTDDCETEKVSLIDDLEDGNADVSPTGGRDGKWFAFADKIGSKIQPGTDAFKPAAGGAKGSKFAVHMTGSIADQDGGWAVVGLTMLADDMFDASKFKAVSFDAKAAAGSAQTLHVAVPDVDTSPAGKICKQCNNDFAKDVSIGTDWKEYVVNFDELTQAEKGGDKFPGLKRDKIVGVQWAVLQKGQKIDFWIDNVKLLCAEKKK